MPDEDVPGLSPEDIAELQAASREIILDDALETIENSMGDLLLTLFRQGKPMMGEDSEQLFFKTLIRYKHFIITGTLIQLRGEMNKSMPNVKPEFYGEAMNIMFEEVIKTYSKDPFDE